MGNTHIASENRKLDVKEAFKSVLGQMETTPSYLVAKEILIEQFGEKVVNDHKKTLTNLLKERSIKDYVIKSFSSGDMNEALIHLGKSRSKDRVARLRKDLMPIYIKEITQMMYETPSTELIDYPKGKIRLCLGEDYGGKCIYL